MRYEKGCSSFAVVTFTVFPYACTAPSRPSTEHSSRWLRWDSTSDSSSVCACLRSSRICTSIMCWLVHTSILSDLLSSRFLLLLLLAVELGRPRQSFLSGAGACRGQKNGMLRPWLSWNLCFLNGCRYRHLDDTFPDFSHSCWPLKLVGEGVQQALAQALCQWVSNLQPDIGEMYENLGFMYLISLSVSTY